MVRKKVSWVEEGEGKGQRGREGDGTLNDWTGSRLRQDLHSQPVQEVKNIPTRNNN